MSVVNATYNRIQLIIREERECYACVRKFQKGTKMLYSKANLYVQPKNSHLCVSCNQIMHQKPEVVRLPYMKMNEDVLQKGYMVLAVEANFCASPEDLIDTIVEWAALTPVTDLNL